MNVGYKEPGPPAPIQGVERLEALVGRLLPAEYRSYLLEQDGGWVEDNTRAVNEIFGVRDDAPYTANLWKKLAVFEDRVPPWLLPVAQDVYGNLFALSMRDVDFGSVWFWDHEEEADEGEEPTEDNVVMVAVSWFTFLNGLQPVS